MLAQKLAVVTGAARGLGLSVARDLAAAGCRVLMVGRNTEAIEDAARQLRESGHDVFPHTADVTDAGAVAALAARLRREFGRADILVNNAGVFPERRNFAQPQAGSVLVVDAEMVAATYACNALAPLRLIQAIVPLMRENGYGRIVNVSSGMGQLSAMGGSWPGYRMSKAALNALTCLTAAELARADQGQFGLPRLVSDGDGRQGRERVVPTRGRKGSSGPRCCLTTAPAVASFAMACRSTGRARASCSRR
jgi:NAD(P)-dependent dehydrogenase (short-subunit alcohol dehydrogenase family)